MARPVATVVAIIAACIGFAASAASLVDSVVAQPAFCAASGCEAVRLSWWSHPFGVPMAALGVAYFAAMLALVVVERPRLRLAGAIAGAAWAIALVAIQGLVIEAWCKLCLVADVSAIVQCAAVAAGARALSLRRAAFGVPVIAAAVLALPVVTAPEPLPPPPADTPACVLREQRPDQITVVEFVDFECPFCRATATELDAALDQVRPLHVVRKMVPLIQLHRHALPAALAWCCADLQGKGDVMAHALFTADPSELTDDGCEHIAANLGLDMERYRSDLGSAARDHLKADLNDAAQARIGALPTLFINGERIVGGAGRDDLVAAIRSFY